MLDINKRIKRIPLLLAGILLILTGCGNESMLDTPVSAGSTVLRISTKGIMVDPATPSNWEEYVQTLRLIGFQEGKPVVNCMLNDLSDYTVLGTGDDTYIEIELDKQPGATIQRGTLDLYAVANESAGSFADNTSLDNISKDALTGLMVTAAGSYNAPTKDNPFLMSGEIHPTLLLEENCINIELVRTVAKVMLESVTLDGNDITGQVTTYTLSASGNVYEQYPLFSGTGTGNKVLSISANDSPLYLSESAASSVDIEVKVTYDGKEYTGTLSQEQINRNDCIQINAIISKQDKCLLLESAVEEWISKELGPIYQ